MKNPLFRTTEPSDYQSINQIKFYLVTHYYVVYISLQVSRVAQRAYLEIEYIRNVLSVSGTLKYADSGTA